jgi:hypothetical protein
MRTSGVPRIQWRDVSIPLFGGGDAEVKAPDPRESSCDI